MARFTSSILGEATGNAGRANFYRWRGKQFVRGRMIERGNANSTPAQLNVQQRFAVLSEFLKKITPALKLGFVKVPEGKTFLNVAFSTNWDTMEHSGSTWTLAPARMVLSNGTDAFAVKATISGTAFNFSWTAPKSGEAYYKDGQLVAAAYCSETGRAMTFLADLSAATATLDYSSLISSGADEVDVWFFTSTGHISSPSLYKTSAE